MGEIRQPKKTTSIEKKNKILQAGLTLFCSKGYYNTTTPEIAKEAGVSTGIVYSYFKDKKDIFLQSLDLYFKNLYTPLKNSIDNLDYSNIDKTIRAIINLTISSHKQNATAHEEMIAMSHLDEDVHHKFIDAEKDLTEYVEKTLKTHGINTPNLTEKVHIMYNLVENLCHEYVFHQHKFINYEKMTDVTISVITSLLHG